MNAEGTDPGIPLIAGKKRGDSGHKLKSKGTRYCESDDWGTGVRGATKIGCIIGMVIFEPGGAVCYTFGGDEV